MRISIILVSREWILQIRKKCVKVQRTLTLRQAGSSYCSFVKRFFSGFAANGITIGRSMMSFGFLPIKLFAEHFPFFHADRFVFFSMYTHKTLFLLYRITFRPRAQTRLETGYTASESNLRFSSLTSSFTSFLLVSRHCWWLLEIIVLRGEGQKWNLSLNFF